ncbi:hypothetical protein M3B38_01785 [Dietzia cinnamea]|uniref:hypothetical protein n=1 Tax=Dietzia cinnamea TaxID=321318 RepID=UPI0021A3A236|nr:hypothetical protein [Dietzia cinnamea]MCT1710719.1 hypothetical protein [Dietzia cinnamea]
MAEQTAGERLAEALTEDGDSAELLAMIEEAGRIKDRLDRLHALDSGDRELWMTLTELRDGGGEYKVTIDQPLQEARQLATVFRQMLAEIARRREKPGGGGGDGDVLDGL